MSLETAVGLAYFAASLLFIFGLRSLGSPRTARSGMHLAELGMVLTIAGTLLDREIITFEWILVASVVGSLVGIGIALWTPMTAMPQRTALSHAFGALAAALVGIAHYHEHGPSLSTPQLIALGFEVMFGSLTVTGSLMAFGKLQEWLPGRPLTFRGQNVFNVSLFGAIAALTTYVVIAPLHREAFFTMVPLAAIFGVMLVLPIGAADMPVVITLLNSYAGLAASATGFALQNDILIIAGALDGASGFILSILMCRAMNRSIANVLFGAFGKAPEKGEAPTAARAYRSATPEEAASILDSAERVIIVPGYGMAVSQAQHSVKKLADLLARKGTDVRFAIHPVAGRMPGHMNVLLAEAGVDYERLFDREQINDDFPRADVALVVGANDVVNPAAKTQPQSPIFGMPVLDVDLARSVMVLKRSMNPGFAGIDNELFYKPNTMMVFGDAGKTLEAIVAELKQLGPERAPGPGHATAKSPEVTAEPAQPLH
jgi:NAD(P) transhydrogenase subunit beta